MIWERKMSKRHVLGCIVAILINFACGCGESDELSIPTNLAKPYALGSQLVFIDKSLHKAFLLEIDPKKIEPRVTEADLPPQPFLFEKRNGADELLVLCAGQRDEEGEEGVDAALAVIKSKGKDRVRTYDIDEGSNSLIQSKDGRYAFIFMQEQSEDAPLASDRITFSQKVVFIDLEQDPSEADAHYSLLLTSSISDLPTGVTFSPEMTIAGKTRRLAVVYSTALVWLIDLSTPDSPPISIQPNRGQQFNFEQALFDEKNKRLFLRGSNADSITVLDLENTEASGSNVLPLPILRDPRLVGHAPSDMALYELGDRTYLLVVSAGSNYATIIDTDSSTAANVTLPVAANKILIHETSGEGQSSPQALLFSQGSDFNGVTFIDLANIKLEGTEREKAESVEAVYFNENFNRLSVLPNNNYVVLTNSNGSQISLLDLTERNVYPIKTPSQMKVIVDPRIDKLWFEPRLEDEDADRLLYLDLKTFSSEDVRLDEKIDHVVLIGDESNAQIAVVHPSSIGYVTILDAESPSRKKAVSVEGFFMSDVLDRGEQ
jgi:hypothetical protein